MSLPPTLCRLGGEVGSSLVAARETPLVQDYNTSAQTAEVFGYSLNIVPSAGTSAANQTYLRNKIGQFLPFPSGMRPAGWPRSGAISFRTPGPGSDGKI